MLSETYSYVDEEENRDRTVHSLLPVRSIATHDTETLIHCEQA